MNSLTKRRLGSLQTYLQNFWAAIPEGEYTTKEIAKCLGMNPTSVAPMVTLLRKKGLIYSVKSEDNARAYIHTKLDEADRLPQGIVKPKKMNGKHRRQQDDNSVTAIEKLFDRIRDDLTTLENTLVNLSVEHEQTEELKARIEKAIR